MAVLAKHGLPLPEVKIGYNKNERDGKTKLNAKRSKELADAVGFASNVEVIAVPPPKAAHPNPFAMATRKEIRKTKDAPLLDQKSTSSMISMLMDAYGSDNVFKAIEERLAKYGGDKKPNKEAQEASDKWIKEQLAKIEKSAEGAEKILLINARNAENQGQHDFSPKDVAALQKKLGEKYDSKVATHVLYCGGGYDALVGQKNKGPLNKETSTNAFTSTAEGINVKVQHLQLLSQIKGQFGGKLVGIIGTTSGTLDAAALLGIETLSLHQFARKKEDDTRTMNEQDQRELLMAFKKVLDRDELGGKVLYDALDAMIKKEEISPFKPWGETRTNINRAFTKYQTGDIKKGKGKQTDSWRPIEGVEDALKEILEKYTAESKDTDKSSQG